MVRKSNKKGRTKASPMLEVFTTYELKRELRRRRREGGWLRWVLWLDGYRGCYKVGDKGANWPN